MDAPLLGTALHAAGATCAACCYTPQRKIREWSWQTFWIVQALICWLIAPLVGAWLTIPELGAVLHEAPARAMWTTYALGVAYGVGGTCFGLAIRYVGFSLTYAVAIGVSCVLGTITGPILRGELMALFSKAGADWILAGLLVGVLGIAFCGMAGRMKELDMSNADGEFSIAKGLPLCLIAGVLSAVYGIAINDTALPIVELAGKHGAGEWRTNVAYIFSNSGAFTTTALYCLYLMKKEGTFREFLPTAARPRPILIANYALAFLTGMLWYGQFLFYGTAHVKMGAFKFVSWALHMIMLILISSLLGIILKEWKACRPRTKWSVAAAIVLLIVSVLAISNGSNIGSAAG